MLHNLTALLHNSADFRNQAYMHPIPLKLDPTSPKLCINHVQAKNKLQTKVKQILGIQNPSNLVNFQGLKGENENWVILG